MTRSGLILVAVAALLCGCPKNVPTTLAGSDDEQMDTLAAQLEEIRTRTNLQCADSCSLKDKVCDLSKRVCELAGKAPDRADFQKKCVASQEDCAHFNESCASCPK